MAWWDHLQDWFWGLGETYQVDPLIFGSIYVGAIPFFFLSLSWLIHRVRHKKSIVIPVLLTGFFFTSAYLYLIIVGENIPVWVYLIIFALVGYGAFSSYQKVKQKSQQKQK
jgi:CHASE2 domain-containing sensor protein